MKANAPEKLYYAPYGDIRENHPITDNDIEYVRKDAFIEKAVKYIANHFLAPGMDNEIKDFVNYMKGE